MSSQEPKRLPSPLGQIYLEHHDRLFRAAYRVVGNANDAADVVQTVFLRLSLREANADNLSAYLYRAVINTAVDLLRARREGQLLPIEAMDQQHDDDSPASDHDHELGARLRQALSRLNPRWAEMFILKYIEGCDNGEIARLSGTSQAVVAVTLFRARSRLKAELTASQGGTP